MLDGSHTHPIILLSKLHSLHTIIVWKVGFALSIGIIKPIDERLFESLKLWREFCNETILVKGGLGKNHSAKER